jgi:LemA protein
MTPALLLAAVLLTAVLGYLIHLYNRFVTLRAFADEAYSGMDVQLKRRHDLIPKLVDVVKGASGFERGVLEEVTARREQAQAAHGTPGMEAAERALGSAVGALMARAEAYPQLKSVQAFLDLQAEISRVEEDLQSARRYYNACVRENNAFGQSFPALLLARPLGFPAEQFFELDDANAGTAPKVAFPGASAPGGPT